MKLPHSQNRSLYRLSWATLALALTVACLCTNAYAASGGLLELPISPTGAIVYSQQSGLDLRIDTTWAGNHGYRPVTCTISARAPELADRQIMIRFMAGNWRNDQPAIVAEKEFELPAGELSTSVRILVPQYVEWRSIGVETWADGIRDEQLSMQQLPFANNQSGQNFAAMIYDDIDRVPWRLFRSIRGGPAELFDPPSGALMKRWVEYSSMDAVVTSLGDLKTNVERDPERLEELVKWIRAGGNLWVASLGPDYEQASAVEALLGVQKGEVEVAVGDVHESLQNRGWRFPKIENQTSDALDQYSQLYGTPDHGAKPAQDRAEEPGEGEPPGDGAPFDDGPLDVIQQQVGPQLPEDSRNWFAVRPVGMGTVTIFAQPVSNLSRNETRELSWAITQSLLADRLSWDIRHGNDPDNGNENFNDFLIPDVGAAPVTAFQVLLSLFVLAIGPVNYFFLKSREKLPLLLFTVPAAASITTLLLLVYGFTSEGFGTLVRARSFTLLDQTSESAVCWTRLSYFTGVAPSEGLEFPADTLIYPILPSLRMGDHREMRRLANQRREVNWNGVQRLTRGWLSSRTPTQYLSITSRDSKKQLVFDEKPDAFQVTNQLGVGVETLIVEAKDGTIYMGENLPAGKSVKLASVEQVQAIQKLRNLMAASEPTFPAGTLESLSVGSGIDLLPFSRNLMETQISAITSAASKGWGPGTYIAVTDRGVDLSLGLDRITENSSFHIVRGTW